jgi:demethylsterigmatocystin 6-O-methyltransferase
VLHDWDDEKSLEILKNLVPAMGPDSLILIDEMVLPNTGVHWWSAWMDLHMLTILGA